MVKTYIQLYSEARRMLSQYEEADYAAFLARQLILHVSGKSNAQFLADQQMYAPETVVTEMEAGVRRLCSGEPLAYVLGEWEFYGLKLTVTPDVLIPRDDTCAVAQLAMGQALFLPDSPRILDLCTGSGCIGLAIAHRVKDAKVTLADISKDALAIAKKNIAGQKLSGRVTAIAADALGEPSAFLGKFDMIVSNPPYITTEEMLSLDHSVKDFEPHLALHGGDDGLEFYRSIAKNYKKALKPGGYLCFEFGINQGDAVCAILEENKYTILERTSDYNGVERAVLARRDREED